MLYEKTCRLLEMQIRGAFGVTESKDHENPTTPKERAEAALWRIDRVRKSSARNTESHLMMGFAIGLMVGAGSTSLSKIREAMKEDASGIS